MAETRKSQVLATHEAEVCAASKSLSRTCLGFIRAPDSSLKGNGNCLWSYFSFPGHFRTFWGSERHAN